VLNSFPRERSEGIRCQAQPCYMAAMGGYLSGRQNGRPTADAAKRIDLAWMLRNKMAVPGSLVCGTISWTRRGEPSGNIGCRCDMTDLENAFVELSFTVTKRWSGESRDYKQHVPLSYTVPHFGGRRWWMHCPVNGSRVGKLYLPSGGDIFASRTAWRLGYHTQRITDHYRTVERLFAIQRKLGCDQGWGNHPWRKPKGMWQRTFDRHMERLWELEEQVTAGVAAFMLKYKR
jgi:hypothetical protein